MTEDGAVGEVRRIRRVADMLCSGHAYCRDLFARRGSVLDILSLISGAFIAAAGFASALGVRLQPVFGISGDIALGIAGVAVFCLSLLPVFVRWKERSGQHSQAADAFSQVTMLARQTISRIDAGEAVSSPTIDSVISAYSVAATYSIAIPEKLFLKMKAYHLEKVFLSQYLDRHPGAILFIVALRNRLQQTLAADTNKKE